MKNECRQIIMDTLGKKCFAQANIESEACREILAKEIEKNIKCKFHIFRINRLMTGD